MTARAPVDARVGAVHGRGGRAGLHCFPGPERAGVRVLGEEKGQGGRPGTGNGDPDQRRGNLLVFDLGVAPVPVLDVQPLRQQADDLFADGDFSQGGQPPSLIDGLDEALQALAE